MKERIIQTIHIHHPHKGEIFKELVKWGESLWWPQGSLMSFKNLTQEIKEGTIYLQKVKLPFGPSWHTRNEVIDDKNFYIKRVFLDGIFSQGYEEIYLKEENNLKKVIYTFSVSPHGVLNKILWRLVFRKLHIKNLKKILNALKIYKEKKE
jgi:hypothetical protein